MTRLPHSETHAYAKYAKAYASLGLKGTFYTAFKVVPAILERCGKIRYILDHGCGGGRSTRFLKSLGYTVAGADVSLAMIEEARAVDPAGEYHHIRGKRLPFSDERFDIIFQSFVLMECDQLSVVEGIFREFHRILKPGAFVFTIVANAEEQIEDWVSFSRDYPPNHTISSGERYRVTIADTGIVLFDHYWTKSDYSLTFEAGEFRIREVHTPLADPADRVDWRSETSHAAYILYLLEKT